MKKRTVIKQIHVTMNVHVRSVNNAEYALIASFN